MSAYGSTPRAWQPRALLSHDSSTDTVTTRTGRLVGVVAVAVVVVTVLLLLADVVVVVSRASPSASPPSLSSSSLRILVSPMSAGKP